MVTPQLWADNLYRYYRTSYVVSGDRYYLGKMLARIEEVMPDQFTVQQ